MQELAEEKKKQNVAKTKILKSEVNGGRRKEERKKRREESENGGKGANEGEALKKKQVRGTK